jgi:hypothetical protein
MRMARVSMDIRTRGHLINGRDRKRKFPQRLKPFSLAAVMSELKLRPPEMHLLDDS